MTMGGGDTLGTAVLELSTDEKKLTAGLKKGQEGFGRFRKQAGLALTAVGGAITGFAALSIKSFAQSGDEVQKMAFRTGFTTEALSELRFAMQIAGTSIEGFEKGIKRMASFLDDARSGLTESIRDLDALGLSMDDFAGKSPEEVFFILTNALSGVEDELQKSALAQGIFGRAGTQLLPLLAEGADGIERLRQEARDLGIVFDQDAANAAAQFNDDMLRLGQGFESVKFGIGQVLLPVINDMVNRVSGVVTSIRSWIDEHPQLARVITLVTVGIGALMLVLGPLLLILPTLITSIKLVGAAMKTSMGPWGLVIAAIAALIPLIILLVKNWDTVVRVITGGANVILTGVENMVNGVIEGLNFIIRQINKLGSIFGLKIGEISDITLPRLKQSVQETAEAVAEDTDAMATDATEFGATVKTVSIDTVASLQTIADGFNLVALAAKEELDFTQGTAQRKLEAVQEANAKELASRQATADEAQAILKAQNEASLAEGIAFAEGLLAQRESRIETAKKADAREFAQRQEQAEAIRLIIEAQNQAALEADMAFAEQIVARREQETADFIANEEKKEKAALRRRKAQADLDASDRARLMSLINAGRAVSAVGAPSTRQAAFAALAAGARGEGESGVLRNALGQVVSATALGFIPELEFASQGMPSPFGVRPLEITVLLDGRQVGEAMAETGTAEGALP